MKRGPRLTSKQVMEMLRRYATSEPIVTIAAEFGVDPSYPGLLAKRCGLPMRRPDLCEARRAANKRRAERTP